MKKIYLQYLICTFLLLFLIPISLTVGYQHISLTDLWLLCTRSETSPQPMLSEILIYHRLPRTLVTLLTGMGLAIGGACYQAILRNPLATPYTLGTASFASLGAYTAYLLSSTYLSPLWEALPIPLSHVFAFLFAIGETVLILLVIKFKPHISATVLLLCGITLGMLANALISILRFWATPDKLVFMERWWFGSTQVIGFRPILTIAPVTLLALLWLWSLSYALDQYSFDTEIAQARGIHIPWLQIQVFLCVSLLTAVIVAEVGPIGFIGLIIPHASRSMIGYAHRHVIPHSALLGAIFLLVCDIFSRKIFHTEVPIGIITTLIGVPAFLAILLSKPFKEWSG